jgi:hypothetical protein
MSLDFTALAGSLAVGVPGVRACLFVSGDGLALASHPASEEAAALAAWARLSELGPLERGFVAMEHENWVFSKRSDYSGLVITDPAVRPGVLLDRLEQALQLAEESRSRHEGMSPLPGVVPMSAAAKEPSRPARRIRLPVHREAPRSVPEPELIEAERVPSRPMTRPSSPPAAPPPGAEPPPSRTRRDEPVDDPPQDRTDTRAPKEGAPEKPARADKTATRGRRGLGEYVGKQSKGGGGRSNGRREHKRADADDLPPEGTVDEAPRAPEAPAPPPQADTAVETERVEVAREEPSEPPKRTRPARLDADLETLLSSPAKPPRNPAQPTSPQGAMLDAVSAALEAPGKAAEDSVAPAEAPAERAPEPEPVVAIPEPEPAVATPEPEPVVAAIPEPDPVLAPEPEPAVAEVVQPVVPTDAVEEAKAAMWRRRMKVKPGGDAKDESKGEPKPGSDGEDAATEPAKSGSKDPDGDAAAEGQRKSAGDVDVVALAREFSGLFGDEGGEG